MSRRLPNVVLSLVGFEGSGKTRFWTTAPKPAVALTSDINTESVVRDVLKLSDDEVRLHNYQMPSLTFSDKADVEDEGGTTWEGIVDELRPMIADADERPKTLIGDTASDLFDLRVMSIFGKLDQIPPEMRRNMMGRANTSYKGIIQAFHKRGCHVILVHRAKEKWEDKEERTQRGIETVRAKCMGPFDMEREGFKGTGFLTSIEVHLAHDPNRKVKEGLSPSAEVAARFGMKIVRCTMRPGLIGREYWGREKLADGARIARASFPYLMTQVFPKTSIEDWS